MTTDRLHARNLTLRHEDRTIARPLGHNSRRVLHSCGGAKCLRQVHVTKGAVMPACPGRRQRHPRRQGHRCAVVEGGRPPVRPPAVERRRSRGHHRRRSGGAWALSAPVHSAQWSRADGAAVIGAMQATHVTDLSSRLVDELSGGQRHRVWVAMMLARETRPSCLTSRRVARHRPPNRNARPSRRLQRQRPHLNCRPARP